MRKPPAWLQTPNDDYETAVVILDELDKGASKRELGRRTGPGVRLFAMLPTTVRGMSATRKNPRVVQDDSLNAWISSATALTVLGLDVSLYASV